MKRLAWIALATILAVAPGRYADAAAQPPAPKPAAKAADPAPARPAPEPAPPPYEPQLLRLAEIMGTLAYLRELCGHADGPEWRNRMASLIAAEGTDDTRKSELAGAFNRGFRGYELTYRKCTPAARVVISRFLDEGGRLARDITGRFGG